MLPGNLGDGTHGLVLQVRAVDLIHAKAAQTIPAESRQQRRGKCYPCRQVASSTVTFLSRTHDD